MHCWRIQIPMEVLIPATLILSRKSNDSSGKPLFQLSYGEFISLIHLIPLETRPKVRPVMLFRHKASILVSRIGTGMDLKFKKISEKMRNLPKSGFDYFGI